MKLANSRVEKKCQNSQEKLGSRVAQVGKNHVYSGIHVYIPIKKSKTIGNRHTNCVLRKRASYALSPPLHSSWVHSPSGHRLWTFTRSKPASGPEFPAPLNPMHPEALSMLSLISVATNLSLGGEQMPSPRPWKMVRYFSLERPRILID